MTADIIKSYCRRGSQSGCGNSLPKPEASQQKFDDISWNYFNGDGSSDNDVIATAQNSISGQYESQDAYQELSFTVSDLPDFSSFAIKIVMKSDNPSYVPKIQDMRTVASF